MNSRTKTTIASFGVLMTVLYVYSRKDLSSETFKTESSSNRSKRKASLDNQEKLPTPAPKTSKVELVEVKSHQISLTESHKGSDQKRFSKPEIKDLNLVSYSIDDGVVVTQGDMVVGEIKPGALLKNLSGQIPEPEVNIWPTNEIPFFIQSDLLNQNRVIQALQMFGGTHVHFVPYTNQNDAIVFERRSGTCKSYVGYIGGLQKIFLADACGPTEIAHEIMHSLGFVHEQSRTDRDQSVQILWDNVDPDQKINFEKFSSQVSRISSSAPFDFESIMIYPDHMFSRNSQPTIKPLVENQIIAPKAELSVRDIERINSVY